jgi:hypothetical protein
VNFILLWGGRNYTEELRAEFRKQIVEQLVKGRETQQRNGYSAVVKGC